MRQTQETWQQQETKARGRHFVSRAQALHLHTPRLLRHCRTRLAQAPRSPSSPFQGQTRDCHHPPGAAKQAGARQW